MKRALFLTAYDRPDYLSQTLLSWSQVRGIDRWKVVVRVEPGTLTAEVIDTVHRFAEEVQNAWVVINPRRYGVLHHPWVGFEELFLENDFVVRAEDDLLVSSDILEYFEWASDRYEDDERVASVHGFALGAGSDPESTLLLPQFSPLVFGTWRDRWSQIMSPTWDHDYSTYNGTPGNQAGWDWNLNTRIFPKMGLLGVYPELSRVSNIGLIGTHSTPENYYNTEAFEQSLGQVVYRDALSP